MAVPHLRSIEETLRELGTSRQGLSAQEAARRMEQYGPNQLEERPGRSPLAILGSQFTQIMVILLLVAAAIKFSLPLLGAEGDPLDAVMILLIVVLNAALGFIQEYRAEKAVAALKQMAISIVRVRRDGQTLELPATQLVPGDIVLVDAGLRIPADGRMIECANLRVEEAALTGESVPVEKIEDALEDEEAPIGDRLNMVFMGTTAVYGRGVIAVTDTGMRTELGHIADLLQEVKEEATPLQRRMHEAGKWLAIGALAVVGVVFFEGVVLGGEDLVKMFVIAISLAVAAVPEGLPAVVTVSLSLGAQRMVRRHALIRKLPAVETLGSVTTICSDKTGTLTENRMTVTALDLAGSEINLGERLRTTTAAVGPGQAPLGQATPDVALLLANGALCNDASLEPNTNGDQGYHTVGDPTEGALVVAAARMGIWKAHLDEVMPRVREVPFTSERKRMTTIHRLPNDGEGVSNGALQQIVSYLPPAPFMAFSKGAVDALLAVSDRVWNNGQIEPLDDAWRARVQTANDRLAQNGMRVLGAAMRPFDTLPAKVDETVENGLIFIGMTGMIDPPRREVRDAVAQCRTAGIRPIMITGDHPLTAMYIARDLGIIDPRDANPRVLTGVDLEPMSAEQLAVAVESVSVYARVSPEHKYNIVEALRGKGEFVAMTGDGVNDAPALKRADIGVAMGITGTDVTKEASDMVLLDDNFATIVAAIEEGRVIYENLRKFLKFLISCNVGEILLLLFAPLLGLPLPLTAVQILFINLVTDGLPALALSFEPAEPDIMEQPPHPPNESIFARGVGSFIISQGLLLGVLMSVVQWVSYRVFNYDEYTARTMVFTALAFTEVGRALAVRSDRLTLLRIGIFSNKYLLGAVIISFLLQFMVVYIPALQPALDTVPLTLSQVLVCLAIAFFAFAVIELDKWFDGVRRRRKQRALARH